MRPQGKAMLNALLMRSPHSQQLFHFLPPALAEEIQGLPTPQSIDFSSLLSFIKWMSPIHYSWFYSPLKTFPEKTRALFLPLLTNDQAKGMYEMLGVKRDIKPPSRFIFPFLLDYLKKEIQEKEIIDEELLPSSEINQLLSLKRAELLHLIDLLGIYDLATDLRQVVDKEFLGKIYAALGRDKVHFLHYCSKQPMKWFSPKLGLARWDGSKKNLDKLLHQRGLIWLARAVDDEDKSFQWHFLHRLDVRRAKIVQKVFDQKQELTLTSYFKNQVLHILKRYKR